uniref:Tetraspanin n=1 Tax=Plectus sambesii TaxID=2011161 RepID=A0A914W8U8_9BILA
MANSKPLETHDKAILIATGVASIVGCILVIIGFVLRFGRGFGEFMYWAVQKDDFLELERLELIFGLYTTVGLVLVLLGGVVVVGILRRNTIILKMYAAVIALMVLVQLVTGLLAFMYRDDINNLINDDVLFKSLNQARMEYIENNNTVTSTVVSSFWKVAQLNLECCGVNSGGDWNSTDIMGAFNCLTANNGKGCEKEIRSRVATDAMYFGVSALGFLLVEVIACFLAGWRALTLAEASRPANPYEGFATHDNK